MSPSEYENALTLISEIESSTKRTEVSFINLSDLVNGSERQKVRFPDALQLINEVESGGRRLRERQVQPSQVITPVQPMRPVPTTTIPIQMPEQQRQKQEEKIEKPSGGFRFGFRNPVPRAPKEAEEQRKQNAAAELGNIVSKLQQPPQQQAQPFPEIKLRKKPNMKDLVLPNLSIADQVSELEQIIEGLRENVFDQEHTDIVMQEIYGMEQMVTDERKKLKGKPPGENELERSLHDIRDQRLTEAAILLQQSQQQGAR